MKRLLVICPSRNRANMLARMLKSFDETKSEGTDIAIMINDDDPSLDSYKEVLKDRQYEICKKAPISAEVNYMVNKHPDYEYYADVADDHIYRTKGWDRILIEEIESKGGWGVAFGWGMIHPKEARLPQAAVVSGNIVRALGNMYDPGIHHTYTDNYLQDIAEKLGILFPRPDVVIEHMHALNGKAEMDDNYRWVLSQEALALGKEQYTNWKRDGFMRDVDKILAKMNKKLPEKIGLLIRCYHATQYLEKVLKQYAWVDKIVLLNYRYNSVEETTDDTKEIFDKFEHPDKVFKSGKGVRQCDILNLGVDELQDCSIAFIADADEFINPKEQQDICRILRESDASGVIVGIVDYNGDLYHASPERGHLTVVAIKPQKTRFGHIRTLDSKILYRCPQIVMQHLGLVFTPEVIDWKSNWEHIEEGHGRDILLKDWAVKREVTPPQWLLEMLNE
jgi:hypothetical protein